MEQGKENKEGINPETNTSEPIQTQTDITQQSVDATPDRPSVELTSPQSGKKWLLPSVIGFLSIVLCIAGYFVYQNFQLKKEQSSLVQPTPTLSSVSDLPTSSINPTAKWKDYSDSTHNVSFKYPPSWVLTKEEGQVEGDVTYNTQVKLSKDKVNITMYFNMDGIGGMPQEYEGASFVLGGYNLYQYKKENSYSNTKIVGISNSLNTIGVFMINNITYSITLEYPESYDEVKETELLNEFNQILSTFKFIENSIITPTPPEGWISHKFDSEELTIYTPNDWESKIEEFPDIPSTLISFWKKVSPDIVPIMLDIKTNWDNTGNAEYLPKTYIVAGNIPAARSDPPKKEEKLMERYETVIFFERLGKVYIFECIHNWTSDYVDTCNKMVEAMIFE